MATIIQINHTQPWYTWKQGCPIILWQQSLLPGATRTVTTIPLTKTKKMLPKGHGH